MTGNFSTETGKTQLLALISDKETLGIGPANLNSSSLHIFIRPMVHSETVVMSHQIHQR